MNREPKMKLREMKKRRRRSRDNQITDWCWGE